MRAKDITPGEVYAYRVPYGPVCPIVFLAPLDHDHLYAKTNTIGPTFRKAPEGTVPREGTVWNAGAIGYPAALGREDSNPDDLRDVTLARFRQVTGGLGRRCEYTLVARLARVIGLWKDYAASPDSSEKG